MPSQNTHDSSLVDERGDHDIFISYSRKNQTFVKQLCTALQGSGLKVWVDWEGIPATVEWRPEIFSNIEAANNFVFVLSPAAIASKVCAEELTHALHHQKRLVPIVCQDVDADAVHPELAKLNWVFFREQDNFDAALQTLVAALETDLKHVRTHTRLLIRAREWESRNRDSSFLLRGNDLLDAQQWLQEADASSPQPTILHHNYIQESYQAEVKQREAELTLRRLTPQQYRNRQALLTKVKNFWVKNVLETSLYGQALIELGLENYSDAVTNPWEMAWATSTEPQRSLPKGTKVIDLFNQLGTGRTLLILGEPGSGKTTALLELTRDLVANAEQNIDQLIPVVFNLSSWAGSKQPIATWLVEELNTKYQIPRKIGEAWVHEQQLLLLLDGLDEVRSDRRDACVQALNEFSQNFSAEMVVCSRIKDYENLSERLQFQGAILIQPLNLSQIDTFLQQAGDKLAAIRVLLQDDATLQDMVRSPLILSIMAIAYEGMAIESLPQTDIETRRRHLFDTYIQRMLQRRGTDAAYSVNQTLSWLRRLARQMVADSQTVFLIERMQPTWLTTPFQRGLYTIGFGITLAIILTVLLQPGLDALAKLVGLIAPLGSLMLGAIFVGTLWGVGALVWKEQVVLLKNRAILGLISGLFVVGYVQTFSLSIVVGILSGIIHGVAIAILVAFVPVLIQPVESLKWTWSSARASSLRGLRWGLLIGFLFGLLMGIIDTLTLGQLFQLRQLKDLEPVALIDVLVGSWVFMLINGLIFALFFELVGGLIGGLIGGLSGKAIATQTIPNQGIWQSARSAVVFAVLGIACMAIVFSVTGAPLAPAVALGTLFGVLGAGIACLQHLLLRGVLLLRGEIPWNYARFLNFAARHVLLQKVGGGYIFIHRLLLEHFAAMPAHPQVRR
jgi:eukaryotic-like serine/threonine-protein kinase